MLKKRKINFEKLIDDSLFLSLFLTICVFFKIFDVAIPFAIAFCMSAVLKFLGEYFSPRKNYESERKGFSTKADINCISEFLNINDFILFEKIGDFYVYKSKNIILPSPKVFVKNNGKNIFILAHSTSIDWIKQGLEEILSTKQKANIENSLTDK